MNYISKSVLVLVLPMLFPNWNFLFSFFKYFKNYFSSSRQLLKYCSLCSFLQAPLEPCIVLNGMDRLVFLYHLIWKSIYIYMYIYILCWGWIKVWFRNLTVLHWQSFYVDWYHKYISFEPLFNFTTLYTWTRTWVLFSRMTFYRFCWTVCKYFSITGIS